MVTGIKNSTHCGETAIYLKAANAKLMECPKVKAVTKIKTRFNSLKLYKTVIPIINKIWS